VAEDPAHYPWTSYPANGVGVRMHACATPHPLYQALGRSHNETQTHYRALFRPQLDRAAVDDIRLAPNQSQPLGNARFYANIEQMTGQWRAAWPRSGPRVESTRDGVALPEQTRLHFSE